MEFQFGIDYGSKCNKNDRWYQKSYQKIEIISDESSRHGPSFGINFIRVSVSPLQRQSIKSEPKGRILRQHSQPYCKLKRENYQRRVVGSSYSPVSTVANRHLKNYCEVNSGRLYKSSFGDKVHYQRRQNVSNPLIQLLDQAHSLTSIMSNNVAAKSKDISRSLHRRNLEIQLIQDEFDLQTKIDEDILAVKLRAIDQKKKAMMLDVVERDRKIKFVEHQLAQKLETLIRQGKQAIDTLKKKYTSKDGFSKNVSSNRLTSARDQSESENSSMKDRATRCVAKEPEIRLSTRRMASKAPCQQPQTNLFHETEQQTNSADVSTNMDNGNDGKKKDQAEKAGSKVAPGIQPNQTANVSINSKLERSRDQICVWCKREDETNVCFVKCDDCEQYFHILCAGIITKRQDDPWNCQVCDVLKRSKATQQSQTNKRVTSKTSENGTKMHPISRSTLLNVQSSKSISRTPEISTCVSTIVSSPINLDESCRNTGKYNMGYQGQQEKSIYPSQTEFSNQPETSSQWICANQLEISSQHDKSVVDGKQVKLGYRNRVQMESELQGKERYWHRPCSSINSTIQASVGPQQSHHANHTAIAEHRHCNGQRINSKIGRRLCRADESNIQPRVSNTQTVVPNIYPINSEMESIQEASSNSNAQTETCSHEWLIESSTTVSTSSSWATSCGPPIKKMRTSRQQAEIIGKPNPSNIHQGILKTPAMSNRRTKLILIAARLPRWIGSEKRRSSHRTMKWESGNLWIDLNYRKYSQFVAHRVGDIIERLDVNEWPQWISTKGSKIQIRWSVRGPKDYSTNKGHGMLNRLTGKNGRYETGLLWKIDEVDFPDSYPMVLKRLVSLERQGAEMVQILKPSMIKHQLINHPKFTKKRTQPKYGSELTSQGPTLSDGKLNQSIRANNSPIEWCKSVETMESKTNFVQPQSMDNLQCQSQLKDHITLPVKRSRQPIDIKHLCGRIPVTDSNTVRDIPMFRRSNHHQGTKKLFEKLDKDRRSKKNPARCRQVYNSDGSQSNSLKSHQSNLTKINCQHNPNSVRHSSIKIIQCNDSSANRTTGNRNGFHRMNQIHIQSHLAETLRRKFEYSPSTVHQRSSYQATHWTIMLNCKSNCSQPDQIERRSTQLRHLKQHSYRRCINSHIFYKWKGLYGWLRYKFRREYSLNRINRWMFIPPASPHMGGCWERLISTVKSCLYESKTRTPKDDDLRCWLMEAMNIVNSRPLTFIPLDTSEAEALTPNHFILGTSNGLKPPGKFTNDGPYLRDSWKEIQRCADIFWKRFITEYVPTLTRRTKWFENVKPLEVGDIVIDFDENNHRNTYRKARVVETIVGSKEQVRRAKVQFADGKVLWRPATRLAVLDVMHQEPTDNTSEVERTSQAPTRIVSLGSSSDDRNWGENVGARNINDRSTDDQPNKTINQSGN